MKLILKTSFGILLIGIILFSYTSFSSAQQVNIAIIDSGAVDYVDSSVSFTSFPANSDPINHGTTVAKLIREKNPYAKIHMLQVCEKIDGLFRPSQDAIINAVAWTIRNGINVVNMSLVTQYSAELENLMVQASQQYGIKFIAASGNKTLMSGFASTSGGYVTLNKSELKPEFPSSSRDVISVGAVDMDGGVSDYSSKYSDVYAYGGVSGQKGTSFACARVTAEVANIVSRYPYATKNQIINYLNQGLSPRDS